MLNLSSVTIKVGEDAYAEYYKTALDLKEFRDYIENKTGACLLQAGEKVYYLFSSKECYTILYVKKRMMVIK